MNDFRRGDGVEGSWIHSVAHHPLESPSGFDFRQRRVECGRRYGCKGRRVRGRRTRKLEKLPGALIQRSAQGRILISSGRSPKLSAEVACRLAAVIKDDGMMVAMGQAKCHHGAR